MDSGDLVDGILVRHRDHPEWRIGSVEQVEGGVAITIAA